MKELLGSPGTVSGLTLRIGQCLFASASIGVMVSALGFSSYTAFCYLIASMGLQVTATLSLAAACSSAGIAVLYATDLNFCKAQMHLPCNRFQLSVALAFVTWFLIAISSHVMFWMLASV
ncbi:hypothetical protein C3L33_20336, partial [Rhododendron williamsianum]